MIVSCCPSYHAVFNPTVTRCWVEHCSLVASGETVCDRGGGVSPRMQSARQTPLKMPRDTSPDAEMMQKTKCSLLEKIRSTDWMGTSKPVGLRTSVRQKRAPCPTQESASMSCRRRLMCRRLMCGRGVRTSSRLTASFTAVGSAVSELCSMWSRHVHRE